MSRVDGAPRQDGRFLNPGGEPAGQPPRALLGLLRAGRGEPWPKRVSDPPCPPPALPGPGEVAVTFVGHSTFLLRFHGGPTLLTDPIWSERCSPFASLGPRRVRPPALDWEALPPLDAVLLSHNHYDHLDLPTLRRLPAGTRVLTGLGVAAYLARQGIRGVEELDWWGGAVLPHGAIATFLPAKHFSARGIGDRCRTLWGGFAVRTPAGALLFAGDTAYGPHLAEIGARAGPFGVGLIPVGAYEPRWFMRVVHVDPAEAVRAQADLRVEIAVAMHFGTFKLTQEAIDAPTLALAAAREAAGLAPDSFRVPRFGETLVLPLAG